jgi:transposase
MARFELSDRERSLIVALLPGAEGKKNGRPRLDDRKRVRRVFEGDVRFPRVRPSTVA